MEEEKKPASLVLFGVTGSGKSTLGNRILGNYIFKEGDGSDSETKETIGQSGTFDNHPVFVVDTPGLHDSEGGDKDHLEQMTSYIKEQRLLQAFVFVIDFNPVRIDSSVFQLFRLVAQMYEDKEWYKQIAIVWTRCTINSNENERFKKQEAVKKRIRQYLIPDISDEDLNSIPQYFLDNIEALDQTSQSYKCLVNLIE